MQYAPSSEQYVFQPLTEIFGSPEVGCFCPAAPGVDAPDAAPTGFDVEVPAGFDASCVGVPTEFCLVGPGCFEELSCPYTAAAVVISVIAAIVARRFRMLLFSHGALPCAEGFQRRLRVLWQMVALLVIGIATRMHVVAERFHRLGD